MKKKSVSLVLGSGGARGYTHIGVIKELERQNYDIKFISGSSIGALIGGLYAAGRLDEYINWVKELNILDILKLVDFSFSKDGMINGDKVFSKIEEILEGVDNIENLAIPFIAVASDIINKKEVLLSKGNLKDAIRASISIPTVFTPKIFDDILLFDGGIVNPLPISVVNKKDTDLLIVVNLNSDVKIKDIHKDILETKEKNSVYKKVTNFLEKHISRKDELSYFQVINSSIETMQEIISKQQLETYKPDIVIEVSNTICDFYDFHKAEELISYGQKITKDILKGVK